MAGAKAAFHWVEAPNEAGNRTATTESDVNGLFALHSQRGLSLGVSVGKEGYYSSRKDNGTFSYGRLNESLFQPSAESCHFPLAEERTRLTAGACRRDWSSHHEGFFARSLDGKPTEVSLRDGRSVPVGQGDLRVEFQAGAALDNFPSRITWQCRVTVPDGGLVQTDEEYPFLAPESGYSGSDEWSIGATNWTEQVQKVYYVKLRDGKLRKSNRSRDRHGGGGHSFDWNHLSQPFWLAQLGIIQLTRG